MRRRWVGLETEARPSLGRLDGARWAVATERPATVLDETALLERIGGDTEFLQELAEMFQQQREQLIEEIRAAAEACDAQALARAAHTLKGCVGNLGAGAAFESARQVEMLARNGQLSEAQQATAELECEVARFEQALLRLAAKLSAQ